MKIKFIAALALWAIVFLQSLVLSPHAQAQGGVPLWTNRYHGPTNSDVAGMVVAVDGSGNVFVTGSSVGTNSGIDYATIKYSSAGVPLWTNRYNGPGNGSDFPVAIAVDSNGNVLVTGPSTGNGTGYDYATIKYSSSGIPLWTNRYDHGADEATAVAVDSSGNVLVTGTSTGNGTGYDYATIKYSASGVPLWTNRYDGSAHDTDEASAVAVDGSGNVFVTGHSLGSVSGDDYATIKYSNAGVPLWTNRYNGPAYSQDFATSLAVDSSGDVIVTGASDRLGDPDYIYFDFVTIKYSGAGVPLWINRYISPGYDSAFASALAVDASGNVFVTGYLEDTGFAQPLTQDFATVAYSSAGVPLWTNRYDGPAGSDDGGPEWNVPRSIAVDKSGNVFVTGYSDGTNGGGDFATIAYSGAGAPLWTNRFNGTANYWDGASAVAVDGSGNVIVTGWSETTLGVSGDFVTIKYSAISPSAIIYNLGTLGGSASTGYAVNDVGQVAGYSSITDDSHYHAFRYDGTPGSGGVMRDLGTLGGTDSVVGGINNTGQVAGSSLLSNGSAHAFRYDGTPGSGGIMRDLGDLGGSYSYGKAINDAGQVVGYSGLSGQSADHAFRYDGTPGSGGVMRDLGTLGGTVSDAYAVNQAGQVAGYSTITAGNYAPHAFRYDGTPGSGGVMRDLGTLGGSSSSGFAVNNAGQVAGYSDITNDTGQHAFRYDGTPGLGGVMRDLGTLGGTYSGAYALNDAGQVAGWSYVTGISNQHAFLYTGTPGVDGVMTDLDAWLDATNPGEGAKWTLTQAFGLSDSGLITGYGEYDDGPGGLTDGTRAFLLDASALLPGPAPQPSLSIQLTAPNQVTISWPSPSTGWVLQQNTSGLSPAGWSDVTGTIQDDGTNRILLVNPTGPSGFYRLFHP